MKNKKNLIYLCISLGVIFLVVNSIFIYKINKKYPEAPRIEYKVNDVFEIDNFRYRVISVKKTDISYGKCMYIYNTEITNIGNETETYYDMPSLEYGYEGYQMDNFNYTYLNPIDGDEYIGVDIKKGETIELRVPFVVKKNKKVKDKDVKCIFSIYPEKIYVIE